MSNDDTTKRLPKILKIVKENKILFIVLGIILTLVIFIGIEVQMNFGIGNVLQAISNFVFVPKNKVASIRGHTNILIMGKAGGSNVGPDLTDTMIFASLALTKPQISLVSIPRDLWIPDIKTKINSAYYWGKTGSLYIDATQSGGGIGFAKIITSEVVGESVQYGVVIDFSAFKDIIDAIGGIEVNVVTSFTDTFYPVAGRENDACGGDPKLSCRYMTVSFNAGPQTMDGERALQFVRSRHAEGIEGTDLAREARQQKVIDAIKNKISKPSVFLSPKVEIAMISILKKYVETDIDLPTAGFLAREALIGRNDIKQYVLPAGMLTNPPASKLYDNLYVFIPAAGNGDWQELNKWFYRILK
jgi:LCP family protein required for cell wall assembly